METGLYVHLFVVEQPGLGVQKTKCLKYNRQQQLGSMVSHDHGPD